MTLFKVFLKMAGKKRVEVGSIGLENPSPADFESVELVQGDADSLEDAITVVFVAK
jgi:hypothetical protein